MLTVQAYDFEKVKIVERAQTAQDVLGMPRMDAVKLSDDELEATAEEVSALPPPRCITYWSQLSC